MSNLNRVFHALKLHHGMKLSRRALKRLALATATQNPNFHRYESGKDKAPWLG